MSARIFIEFECQAKITAVHTLIFITATTHNLNNGIAITVSNIYACNYDSRKKCP